MRALCLFAIVCASIGASYSVRERDLAGLGFCLFVIAYLTTGLVMEWWYERGERGGQHRKTRS